MKKTALLLIVTLLSLLSRAQENYIFTSYSANHGLKAKNTMDILQDHKGMMWLATWDGLYKFDGYTFYNYKSKPGDGVTLSSNRFDRLQEGADGTIWIRGYDDQTYAFSPTYARFLSLPVACYGTTSFFPIGQHDVLIKTEGNQLIHAWTDTLFTKLYSNDITRGKNIHTNMVLVDAKRRIWVMTRDGLYTLEKDYQLKTIQQKGNYMNALEEGGQIYFGCGNGQVKVLSDNRWSTIDLGCSSNVTSIAKPGEWLIAFGTDGDGIYLYNTLNHEILHYCQANSLGIVNDDIRFVQADSHGDLWADMRNGGLAYMKAGSGVFKNMRLYDKYGNTIDVVARSIIVEDKDGEVWVSPGGTGLARLDRESGELETICDEAPIYWSKETNLASLYADHQGNVWYCAKNIGLRKVTVQDNLFKTLATSDNDYENNVRGMAQDRTGRIWTGNKGGTVRIYDSDMRFLGSLRADGSVTMGRGDDLGKIYCFCEDHAGNMWIGTKGNGLFKATPQPDGRNFRLTHYKHDAKNKLSLSDDNIFSLHEDVRHRLWVATYGGGPNYMDLNNPGEEQFINFHNRLGKSPADACGRVRYITSDKKGNVWICTTGGLVFTNGKQEGKGMLFTRFTRNANDLQSLSYNDVHMAYISKAGHLYVCTNGGGFQKMLSMNDGKIKMQSYTQTEGLGSDVVLSVTEDTHGNLWIGTEESVSKYYPEDGKIETFSIDIVPHRVTIGEGASMTTADGHICLPTYGSGMLCFNPDDLKASEYVPHIVFTRFMQEMKTVTPGTNSILSTDIDEASTIRLPHDKNSFSIEFSAIDYRFPDKVEYAYRLKGFEDNWIMSGTQRIATYTNLPKGKYTLQVRSTNSDRVWVDNMRTLNIEVLPSFWETPWAYLLYSLALLLLILLTSYLLTTFYRLREKVTTEQQISDLKVRFFTYISHELRTPLTLIHGFMEQILNRHDLDEKLRSQLSVVGDNTHRMLQLTNQILDLHKIESDKMHMRVSRIDLVPFVKSVMDNFDNIALDHQTDYRFECREQQLLLWADSDKLDKIVFNLVSNAFKYTPIGKMIKVSVESHGDMAVIKVADQGVGISKDNQQQLFKMFSNHMSENIHGMPSSGVGLSLVKELVSLHGGAIEVESEPGRGSVFTVTLPRDREHFSGDVEFIMSDGMAIQTGSRRSQEAAAETTPEGDGIYTVLIVEDNDEMRYLLSTILINHYRLLEAENGEVGLAMARQHVPDIIISDIMMPVMDGHELLRQLRASDETNHIPVVMLTAVSNDESKIESMRTGAESYIVKPFNSELLKARVANLLEERRRLQAYWRKRFSSPTAESGTDIPRNMPAADVLFLERLDNAVNRNMDNGDFSVDDLAALLHMSRSVLFKKMKAMTGMSPNEYIKSVRMEYAAQLIRRGEYTITEITYMVGINDPHYFSNCFKRQFGLSPTEYRKQTGHDRS